jgi:hypothetical protein
VTPTTDGTVSPGRGDRGAGLIGLLAGVTVTLAFVLFSMQLLMNLYTTSVVTSAGYEGARSVAGQRVDHTDPAVVATARRQAEHRVRHLLGRYGERVSLDWSASTPDVVALRLRGGAPRFLLPGLPAGLGTDEIDRTVRVRVERLR